MPKSEAVLDSIFLETRLAGRLDTLLYDAVRLQNHPLPLDDVLRGFVERYDRDVAESLLWMVHAGTPHLVAAENRGRAAIAYGVLHTIEPDIAPGSVLPALLLEPYYADGVTADLARATRYFSDDLPEVNRALATVPCRAAFHLRPFVKHPGELEIGRSGKPRWYFEALGLLREVTLAIASRPRGKEVVEEFAVREPNRLIARQLREWAAEADTLPLSYR